MEYRAEVIWAKLGTMNVKRQMQEHCHACFQMYYMISGSACFVIGGQHIHVSEGSCFLIPPMVYHGMLPLEHNAAQCIEMKLVVNDPDLQKLLTAVPEPLSDIGPIRKQLLYAEANWNSRQPQTLRNIADILTALLLTFAADDLTSEIKPDSRHILTDGYSELTQSVFSYIERNYPHPFSLEDMGIALNYNKNYLCSAFRKNTGICIIDYLNFIRDRKSVV